MDEILVIQHARLINIIYTESNMSISTITSAGGRFGCSCVPANEKNALKQQCTPRRWCYVCRHKHLEHFTRPFVDVVFDFVGTEPRHRAGLAGKGHNGVVSTEV